MLKLFITIIFFIVNINNAYCSSAMYASIQTGEHFSVKNRASGDEADPKAKKYCEEKYGLGNCKLIYKTDYGGYGAIAIGNRSSSYAYGRGSQAKADKLALDSCKEDSRVNTCRITSRWKDEGKRVYYTDYSQNSNNNDTCGVNPATGYPILCSTGLDVQGNPSGYKNGMHINQITQPNRY